MPFWWKEDVRWMWNRKNPHTTKEKRIILTRKERKLTEERIEELSRRRRRRGKVRRKD